MVKLVASNYPFCFEDDVSGVPYLYVHDPFFLLLFFLHCFPILLHSAKLVAILRCLSCACRDGCLFLCQIKCFGLSCATPSTWSIRQRCRATEACLRRTWSSWLKRPSAAPATTLTTTGAWRWPGHSLTGSAPVSLPRDPLCKHAEDCSSLIISFHEWAFIFRAVHPLAFEKRPTGQFLYETSSYTLAFNRNLCC